MNKRPVTSMAEANAAIDRAVATLEASRPRGMGWRPRVGVGRTLGSVIGQVQAVRDYYSRVMMSQRDPIMGPITHLESIFTAAANGAKNKSEAGGGRPC